MDKRADQILKQIHKTASRIKRNVNLMEVCGTHTRAVSQYGIRDLMPENIKLTTGPGCPVCVTSQKDIDAITYLAKSGIPIITYGDMVSVPGYYGSLDNAREEGAKVFSVYSIDEALKMNMPDAVFFGIGFETTAPMTAYAVKKGLTVYSAHKLFLPAMKALIKMGEIKIDGFIAPGHVSSIIGVRPYEEMKVPQVISGFEPEDILVAILMLLKQIDEGRAEVENEYLRAVKYEGNTKACEAISDVFEVKDGEWRGFGIIPGSGLEIKDEYKDFDAKVKYKDIISKVDSAPKISGCKCGEIIRGLKTPQSCPLFGSCSPSNPHGPCMVSAEGACNVEYRYGKK